MQFIQRLLIKEKNMKHIAKALVYICEYVDMRSDEHNDEDDDIEAVQHVAALLDKCDGEERKALKKASLALAEEEAKSEDPNEEMVEDYENWVGEYLDGK